MSAIGLVAADASSVFSPTVVGAGALFGPAKLKASWVGLNGPVGRTTITYVWALPGKMFAPVSSVPVTTLVAGSVVWKWKVAGAWVTTADAVSATVSRVVVT